jgi:hypothetical protein
MAFYKVPGVTMALIDGNATAWSRTYGILEAGTTRPVTTDSIFEAASATRALTTVVVLRLVERGVLAAELGMDQLAWAARRGSSARRLDHFEPERGPGAYRDQGDTRSGLEPHALFGRSAISSVTVPPFASTS